MSVRASIAESAAAAPGDELLADPDVVMDRGFDLPASPEAVWPWLVQIGKGRAGWYLPAWADRLVPPGRRALRHIDPRFADLAVGDVIGDWGGRDATLTVETMVPAQSLVFSSTRGRMRMVWSLALRPDGPGASRLHLRLRLSPVRRKRLAEIGGGAIDWLTIALLAAGLRDRLATAPAGPTQGLA